MNGLYVLIFGLPLAALIAVASSLPILFVILSGLMLALWLASGRTQQA